MDHLPPFPKDSDIRRVWPFARYDARLCCSVLPPERLAHHEAGHVVAMEWVGLTVDHAFIAGQHGAANFKRHESSGTEEDRPLPGVGDPVFERAALQLAAMYHAGLAGEMLHQGITWTGFVYRPHASDFQIASRILEPYFGRCVGPHAHAQRLALAVLARRWSRVECIAKHLLQHGRWEPEGDARLAC